MTKANDTSESPVLHVYMRDEARGKFLSTRPAGKQVAGKIERLAEEPGDLILDFSGVEAATPPFLQEVTTAIRNIVTANEGAGRIILAAHLNDDLEETMRFVAARTKRGVAVIAHDHVDLLESRPQLAETLKAAQKLKPFFTAPQLAEKLAIKPDAATQRLKKLVNTGAAVRRDDPEVRQGVRHLYRVIDQDLLKRVEQANRTRARRGPKTSGRRKLTAA